MSSHISFTCLYSPNRKIGQQVELVVKSLVYLKIILSVSFVGSLAFISVAQAESKTQQIYEVEKLIFNNSFKDDFANNRNQKSICGMHDERELSQDSVVGRAQRFGRLGGCSITMIGRTCAITAGHCFGALEEIHFNTELTRNEEGELNIPALEDIYNVDPESIVHYYAGIGEDFAVLRLAPNELTGELAGDSQGYLEVSFDGPAAGDLIRITGYGVVPDDDVRTFSQQTHTGQITSFDLDAHILRHVADTTGGNSGSAVVDEATGKVIGVHTHAGCSIFGGANRSTLVANNEPLQDAVTSCLAWENENL